MLLANLLFVPFSECIVAPSLCSVECLSQMQSCYLCLPVKKTPQCERSMCFLSLHNGVQQPLSFVNSVNGTPPPKFKVNVFVIVHPKSPYSHDYLQTKDKHVLPAWRYKKPQPYLSSCPPSNLSNAWCDMLQPPTQ